MSNNSIECRVFIISLLLTATLFSCGNKHNSQTETDMPKFAPKFPQKTVWIHHGGNDSTAITFSSMEEAEWKLVHLVPNCSYEDFEKILLSDPSSIDYPFDSLLSDEKFFCDVFPPVTSTDGNLHCFGLFPHSAHEMPMMLAFYKLNGDIYRATDERSENCHYCLRPDTIFSFPTGHSTLYFVWGYNGYTGSGYSYRLCAFELDSTGLHPVNVFEEKGGFSGYEEHGQSLYTEICTNDEMFSDLFEYDFLPLVRFDSNESAIYIRIYTYKEADEFGCTSEMTEFYRKFVWNGKKFVFKGTV